jgi:trimethylamine-N-oxide reductase (cytochrome c)
MYHSENLEFVVSQSIWFEGETQFADVILPACTKLRALGISPKLPAAPGIFPILYAVQHHRVITFQ